MVWIWSTEMGAILTAISVHFYIFAFIVHKHGANMFHVDVGVEPSSVSHIGHPKPPSSHILKKLLAVVYKSPAAGDASHFLQSFKVILLGNGYHRNNSTAANVRRIVARQIANKL
jgi:hypothetical protein